MAVNYQPINWVNGQAPALNATNLNHMDGGIKAAVDEINNIQLDLVNTETKANKISSFDVNFSDAEKYPTVLAVKKFLDEYYYTFADVDSALTGKADKSTTLAGYGITDAYTNSYIDKLLNNKLDKMGFDSEPMLNSPNYLTSGTVYTSLQKKADNTNIYNRTVIDSKFAALPTYEEGSGNFIEVSGYEGAQGTFNYVKIGKIVNLSATVETPSKTLNYFQLDGIPFQISNTHTKLRYPTTYNSNNKLVMLQPLYARIGLKTLDNTNFTPSESISFNITYQTI